MDQTKFSTKEISKLPNQPGVYKYFNTDDQIIYIGKAKDLRKRVGSYFTKAAGVNRKTLKLVSEVAMLEVVIVNSEFDALLLENSLIKEYQPKYNILLKDDKSFPSILITKDRFPKIYATRRVEKDKGEYFGPYTSVKAMNNVLDLIRKLYKIRTCNLVLSEKNIEEDKFKVCLEYHLGNCLGPCVGKQEESNYLEEIEQARYILKGNIQVAESYFNDKMKKAAESMAFEQAQQFKDRLDSLEKFQTKSLIVSQKISEVDVFTISTEEDVAYVNYMRIQHGAINLSETVELKRKLDETDQEILIHAIISLQQKFNSPNYEILTNIEVEPWDDKVKIYQPKIGDKRKLVSLSMKNVLFYKKDKINKAVPKESNQERILKTLREDLRLTEIPDHIECFDNSNIQGTNPVASMVCFKNGKPSKKDYRHFKIKTVVGADDFGSMKEIVFRRYSRLLKESSPL
ncbi:MAG: excinuclease ABC subunit UvrC, partial [Cyclobacteriaceae bacterium]